MITKRFILIIALLTLLGFITAWQQIQTVRFGYKISEIEQYKKQLVEQRLNLTLRLAQLKSPQNLLAQAKVMKINFSYPQEWSSLSRAVVPCASSVTKETRKAPSTLAHR